MRSKVLVLLRRLYSLLKNCFDTALSLIRILLYSKPGVKCDSLSGFTGTAFVLGNGPSLKELIETNEELLAAQTLIVVNDFFLSEKYNSVKPAVYVIADPLYWEQQVPDSMLDLRHRMLEKLLNQTDWDMLFFVPVDAYKSGVFQNAFMTNSHIKIKPFNSVPFKGPERLRFFFYDRLLSRPFSNNVIGSALYITLQMKVNEIFLFGVEHNWSPNLYVDDQNRTCMRTDHFFSKEQQGKIWLKSSGLPYTIDEALSDVSGMLGGYRELNRYALHKGVRIYNSTPGSFIDVFERKKPENIR